MIRAALFLDCHNTHGEEILWGSDSRRLRGTDIHGKRLWSLDPASGEALSFPAPARICCFAPRADGGYLVAFAEGFALYALASGARRDLGAFEPDLPGTRLNDGRTDRSGRFVVGGMDEADGRPVSSVYLVDADLSVRKFFVGIACANAACFSPDGRTMYFADSPRRASEAIPYDSAAGTIGERQVICTFDGPGVPDGACVDAEGCAWVAIWGRIPGRAKVAGGPPPRQRRGSREEAHLLRLWGPGPRRPLRHDLAAWLERGGPAARADLGRIVRRPTWNTWVD